MTAESSFFYFFSIIILYFKQKRNEKLIFGIAVFTLCFTVIYYTKNATNFLKKKEITEAKFSKIKDKNYKKYFYNNSTRPSETVYEIPFINKKIKYDYPDAQLWLINKNIIMTKDSALLWITQDTIRNKKEVIYATDLE